MPKPMPVLAALLLLASSALLLGAEAAAANYRRLFNYHPRTGPGKGGGNRKMRIDGNLMEHCWSW